MSKISLVDGGWSTLIDAASEAELISRGRAGDHTAFVSLLQLHDAHLRRIASNAMGGPEAMDMVLAQVYTDARPALLKSQDERPFGTWLVQMVFDACDEARTADARPRSVDEPEATEPASAVRAKLAEMPMQALTAITLVAGEALELQHVVAMLDTSVDGLSRMLSKARKGLDPSDSAAADQLVAELAVPRHGAGFWNELNRTFAGPPKNPVPKRLAKLAAATEAKDTWASGGEQQQPGLTRSPRMARSAAGVLLLLLALTISMLTRSEPSEKETTNTAPAAEMDFVTNVVSIPTA